MVSHPDRRLFRDSMKGATIMKQDTIRPYRKKPMPNPTQTQDDERDVLRNLLRYDLDPVDHENGDELLFVRGGVQRNIFRKLRRGEFLVEKELDLHGYRVLQARETLAQFLREARVNRYRCVRIIHGKGLGSPAKQSVLKQKVSLWLKQRDEVLAFCAARSFDGGSGAIYVLLKRK